MTKEEKEERSVARHRDRGSKHTSSIMDKWGEILAKEEKEERRSVARHRDRGSKEKDEKGGVPCPIRINNPSGLKAESNQLIGILCRWHLTWACVKPSKQVKWFLT